MKYLQYVLEVSTYMTFSPFDFNPSKREIKIDAEGFNSLFNVKTKEHFLFMEYLLYDENKIIKMYINFRM